MERYKVSDRDVAQPDRLRQIIDRLYAQNDQLLRDLTDLRSAVQTSGSSGTSGAGSAGLTAEQLAAIQALIIGSTSTTIPAQNAQVPTVTTLPPANVSTPGELKRLAADGVVYIYVGPPTSGWVSIGAAAAAHNLLSATHADTTPAAPVLGDLIYAGAGPAWTKLAGSINAAKRWLRQTGTGALSAAPAWDQPASTDLSDSATLDRTVGSIALTGQTAALPATDVAAALTAGLYALVCHMVVTVAGTAGKIQLNVLSTDRFGAFAHNNISDITGTSGGADVTINGRYRVVFPVRAAGGSAIQVSTTFSGVTGSPQYALDAAVMQLA
jgi:hypothetical protein